MRERSKSRFKKSEKQGEKNYLVKVAKRMLKNGYPIEDIWEINALAEDEILQLH